MQYSKPPNKIRLTIISLALALALISLIKIQSQSNSYQNANYTSSLNNTLSSKGISSNLDAKTNSANQTVHLTLVTPDNVCVNPITFLACKNDLYFLSSNQLYLAKDCLNNFNNITKLTLTPLLIPNSVYQYNKRSVKIQELTQFSYNPSDNSLIIIDKTSAIFRYDLKKNQMSLLRPNAWFYGEPDPQFIDITGYKANTYLLDPERNQLWLMQNGHIIPMLNQVFAWQLKGNCVNLTRAMSLSSNYIIIANGQILSYDFSKNTPKIVIKPVYYKHLRNALPTRLIASANCIYTIYQGNCLVACLNLKTRSLNYYQLDPQKLIRNLIPINENLLILANNELIRINKNYGKATYSNNTYLKLNLPKFTLPVKFSKLPNHPGVYPGARRIYRHGFHKGIDFFVYGKTAVKPNYAYSAAAGKIVRLDKNYQNLTPGKRQQILAECSKNLESSAYSEDLLRGCQVWINHGNGIVTKYAHLNNVNPALKLGQYITANEMVGQIGSSGTSEGTSKVKTHEHLHFEIWVKDEYLGYGLTESETIALYQRLFYGSKNYY